MGQALLGASHPHPFLSRGYGRARGLAAFVQSCWVHQMQETTWLLHGLASLGS